MKKKVGLVLSLTLLISFSLVAKENSRFWVYVNSGLSFPLTPKVFPENWDSSYMLGGGFGISLSPKLALQGSFSYYSFSPKNDYVKYMWIGNTLIDISDWNWYIGDHFSSFYNFLFGVKYNFNRNRLSPYMSGDLGITIHRWVSGGYTGIYGESLIISTWTYFSAAAAIGLEYLLCKKVSLFIESSIVLTFINDDEVNRIGSLPLKTGFIFYL